MGCTAVVALVMAGPVSKVRLPLWVSVEAVFLGLRAVWCSGRTQEGRLKRLFPGPRSLAFHGIGKPLGSKARRQICSFLALPKLFQRAHRAFHGLMAPKKKAM